MFNKNMKRAICIVLLLVTAVLIFCGCTDPETGLSKKVVKQIKQTYVDTYKDHYANVINLTLDDVDIVACYGTYNGYVAVLMRVKGLLSSGEEEFVVVADVTFSFSRSNVFLLWKDNQFYELKETYENGWLTKENVQSIADKHHGIS